MIETIVCFPRKSRTARKNPVGTPTSVANTVAAMDTFRDTPIMSNVSLPSSHMVMSTTELTTFPGGGVEQYLAVHFE